MVFGTPKRTSRDIPNDSNGGTLDGELQGVFYHKKSQQVCNPRRQSGFMKYSEGQRRHGTKFTRQRHARGTCSPREHAFYGGPKKGSIALQRSDSSGRCPPRLDGAPALKVSRKIQQSLGRQEFKRHWEYGTSRKPRVSQSKYSSNINAWPRRIDVSLRRSH